MKRMFPLLARPRRACVTLGLMFALACVPGFSFAAQGKGLVVTPLGDDTGGASGQDNGGRLPGESVPFFNQGGASGQGQTPPVSGESAGDLGTSAYGTGPVLQLKESPSYKDGIIMAYLVELMRKQDKPCPSGAKPPVPPSLLFSEPLCRVAETVGKGGDFPAAYEEQGIYASRWRMFSAADQPAQQVAQRLRAEHCEALLEPHTHIGAWLGPGGWRIVLATLTNKPAAPPAVPSTEAPPTTPPTAPEGGAQPAPEAVPRVAPQAVPALPAPVPVPSQPSGAAPAAAAPATPSGQAPPTLEYAVPAANAPNSADAAPAQSSGPAAPHGTAPRPGLTPLAGMPLAAVPVPGAAAPAEAAPAPAMPAQTVPIPAASPAPAPAETGQEARALFQLLNDLRTKGGSCLGKPARTAPPLAFNAGLQAAAEKEAGDASTRGSFDAVLGVSPDAAGGGVRGYGGAKVSKLTAKSRPPASVVLDVWMVSPTRCDMLLSPDYQDVGAAYVDGHWVLLMGQRAGAAPEPAKKAGQ